MTGLVNSHIMQRDNGRMRKLAHYARFLKEALPGLAMRQFLGKKLNGYQAADEWIVGPRHAAVGS